MVTFAVALPLAAQEPAELPPRHAEWLLEVAPLLLDEEREAFLELEHDHQRDAFVRRFWELRDPYPQTPRNELRDRWEPRVEAARQRYGDLADPRARMLLVVGEPERVIEPRCGGTLRPMEIWVVSESDLVRGTFALAFVAQGSAWRLWAPSEGLRSLLLFPGADASDAALLQRVQGDCFRGDEVLGALAGAVDWRRQEAAGAAYPRPDPEWVLAFRARSTDLPEGAELLPARLETTFPARRQSRTVVHGILSVPAATAATAATAEGPAHAFVVDGEILRQGELFDTFRYRFDVPAAPATDDRIPLVFERYLRPGDYEIIVRLEDVHGGRHFRHRGALAVPLLPRKEPVAATGSALPPLDFGDRAEPGEAVVKLAAPVDELLTGLVRLHADVEGEGVARVRFELDDRPVLTRTRPPYTVEIDLGRAPRLRTVRAVAEGADGETLASDAVALNAGPHRFAVRLVEPRPGTGGGAALRAHAVVDVPRGERLDRVELFLDETRLATLYQPPFVQPLAAPRSGDQVSYVRAVAHLAGGASAEDVVFLHAPDNLDRIEVRLVELFTTVLDRRGRPALGLTAEDFVVEEDGSPQSLVRFEWVEDLPVHAAVLLDTSTSMMEEIDEAERAAETFFRQLMTPRDRAAVITFDDHPRLRVPFTNQVEVLAGGLADLQVEGETALWDAAVYSLYYFGGVRGRRLLVILSDGEDVKSRYRFDDVLDLAHRSGVAIYTIGLGLGGGGVDLARSALSRLASETGGRAFFVSRAGELDGVYAAIEQELRSQYLLAYQAAPATADEAFRAVEVEVRRPGLTARTIKGYVP